MCLFFVDFYLNKLNLINVIKLRKFMRGTKERKFHDTPLLIFELKLFSKDKKKVNF